MVEKNFTRKAGKVAPQDKHLSTSIVGIDPEHGRDRSKQAPPAAFPDGARSN